MNTSFLLFLKGFLVGSADIVPGVSGGTMALITGIYTGLLRAILSVNTKSILLLLTFRFKEAFKIIDHKFILPLLAGIFSAMLIMSRFLHFLLSEYPEQIWSIFFGFVLSSALVLFASIPRKTFAVFICFLLGIVSGYFLVSFDPFQGSDQLYYLFFSGIIAICAMILPGISGSYILVVLGNYYTVLEIIRNPFSFDHLLKLAVFGLGAIIGLAVFSRILDRAVKKFEFLILAGMTGIMLGSLKKMWPWKETIKILQITGTKKFKIEQNILPNVFDVSFYLAIFLLIGSTCLGYFFIRTKENFESHDKSIT